MNLKTITEAFEKTRADLRKSIGKYDDADKSSRVYQHIAAATSKPSLKKIQLKELKCFVGGYVFINPENGEVTPLFGKNERIKGEAGYPLTYVWENISEEKKKPFNDFLDNIFIAWRESETIKSESYFRPEYLYHLPGVEKIISPEIQKHASEKKFNDETGCHYCPMGEVSFFLYAWRFFIRTIWLCNGNIKDSESVLTLDDDYQVPGNISKHMWSSQEINSYSQREKAWIDFQLRDAEISNNELQNKLDRLQESLPITKSPWKADWEAMLLTKANNGNIAKGELLIPLLRYAHFLAVSNNYALKSKISKYLDSLINNKKGGLSKSLLVEIDTTLRDLIVHYFSEQPKGIEYDVKKQLTNLHSVVRFPVIAYFYWNYFDKSARTHLVIPVWTSSIEEVLLPFKNKDTGKLSNTKTGILGVAVIGTKPFLEFDWTFNVKVKRGSKSLRFALIRQYYEIFNQYITDDWYFQRLRVRELERTEEIVADLDHRLGGSIGSINTSNNQLFRILSHHERNKVRDEYNSIRTEYKLMTYYLENLLHLAFGKKEDLEIIDTINNIVSRSNEVYSNMIEFTFSENSTINWFGYQGVWYAILFELFYNSVKAVRQKKKIIGRITVQIDEHEEEVSEKESIRNIELIIADNGIGIPVDYKEEIFKRGFKVNSESEGTGFGLYRVKKLVEEELLGTIREDGDEGIGAKFVINFNIAQT